MKTDNHLHWRLAFSLLLAVSILVSLLPVTRPALAVSTNIVISQVYGGSNIGGIPGALAALFGSILPPTVLMLGIISILQSLRGKAWLSNFVRGLAPAVAVLMVLVD